MSIPPPPPPPPPGPWDEPVSGAPAWFREPTLGQRFLGAIVDNLVLFPVFLLQLAIGSGSVAAAALGILVSAAYHVILIARDGQTVGKRVLGTRAVDLATGATPTLDRSALRWVVVSGVSVFGVLGGPIASILGIFSVIVLIPILSAPLHRGLHDLAAGTIVTSVR